MTYFYRALGILALTFIITPLSGQDWVDGMKDHNTNFYQVQKDFNTYWEGRDIEKGKGWKQFKRWEAFMEPRVYPTGERPDPTLLYSTIQSVQGSNGTQKLGDWQPVGPFLGNNMGGIGRINCIAFDPQNSDTIYAGAPAGGFWASYDGGQSWITTTDQLVNIGVSSIAVDPNNPNVIYIGTGDRDGGDTYSFGIMKSTDGGHSWASTGYTRAITNQTRIGQVWVNPSNSQVVIAATWNGLYRSSDAGQSWQSVGGGTFHSIKANPLNPNVLYAATIGSNNSRVFKSTDNGLTWSLLSQGLPSSGVRRVEIGLTPHDTSYVYLLYGNSGNGFHGMYRSTNGGQSFSLRANSPNLMGWSTSGNDSGGQAWYDLCIAVDPTNKEVIYTGGVNIWKSTNGGSSWSLDAHWYGGGGAPYVHADHHYMEWQPGTNKLWIGNDGGITSKSHQSSNYTDHNDGLNITMYYKVGITESNTNKVIGGAQDNGTHLMNIGWNRIRGGDGMDCEIDPVNENVLYSSVYYGQFRKSTNNGQSWNANFNLPPAGQGNWVTPFAIDPSNNLILYAGFNTLWKSTNGGSSFTSVSGSLGGGTNIDHVAVSPSNGNYVYVAVNERLYKSTNGGSNFTLISSALSNSNSISDIAIDPFNPNNVYITKSGYSANAKVYRTPDGGSSWENLSSGLPNLPANAIVYQSGTNGGIYVGTDVGVYYRDDITNKWAMYMKGLPNVIVRDLEIRYTDNKIVAGTYGRGVWESPLITELKALPIADFSATPRYTCSVGDTINLEDLSKNFPTNWKWKFYPTTPQFVNGTSDSSIYPQVVFSQPGSYTVELIASNQFGSSRKISSRFIEVGGATLPFQEDFEKNWQEYWEIDNPDGGNGWSGTTVPGTQPSNRSAFVELYNYSNTGQVDALITPPISLAGVTNPVLTFDHAYAPYNGSRADSLVIKISDDCGLTYQRVAGYSGSALSTTSSTTSAFVPSGASDWCLACKTISLSSFSGQSAIRVRFEVHNQDGNNIYLDNINITGTPQNAPVADLLGDTVICSSDTALFQEIGTGYIGSIKWQFSGGTPSTSTQSNPRVYYGTPGTYPVSLVVSNGKGQDSIYKAGYITVNSSVTSSISLTASSSAVCEGEAVIVTANPVNGGAFPSYEWYLNGTRYGGTSSSQVFPNLQVGDVIKGVLRSSDPCSIMDSVSSPPLSITVNAKPVVSLASIPNTCISSSSMALSGGSPSGGVYKGVGVANGQFDPQVAGIGYHDIWYVVTNSSGCKDSATTTLRVEQEPTAFLTVNDLCENDGAMNLNGGFPFGGVYTVDGDTATSIDPGQLPLGAHVVTYYVPVGSCVARVTDTVEIFANPAKPLVSVTWGSMTCNLTGVKYQWYDASGNPMPGDTNKVFYPSVPGQYKVVVTNENGCTSESSIYTITNVGLDEWAREHNVSLYPNPTKGVAKLGFTTDVATSISLDLFNTTGQLVWSNEWEVTPGNGTLDLDLGNLPPGIYFLHMGSRAGTHIIKVNIQN